MANIPRDSIQKLFIFQQEVSKLFRNIFEETQAKSVEKKVLDNLNFPVLIDVFETQDAVNVEVELPGVDRDNIDVTISGNTLVINGIKQDDKKERENLNYFCMERDFGKFHRVVDLPVSSDTTHAQAIFRNGLLAIIFPRIEERRGRSRKIGIQLEE